MRAAVLIPLFMLACFAPGASGAELNGLNEKLAAFHLRWNGDQPFSVKKALERKSGDRTFLSLSAERDTLRLDLELINPLKSSDGAGLVKTKTRVTRDLYEDQPTPYGGETTTIMRCSPGQKPKAVIVDLLGEKVEGLLGGASDRRTFGACVAGQVKYMGLFVAYYDKSTRTFLQIKVFEPAVRFRSDQGKPLTEAIARITRD